MEVLGPYSTSLFNTLRDVDDSSRHFDAQGGPHLISNALQKLFIEYDMTSLLGLVLVHRHFSMESQEVLVDVNGSSTPWSREGAQVAADGSFEKYGGHVKPSSWLVSEGRLMPYEFCFVAPQALGAEGQVQKYVEISPEFVSNFATILTAHGLMGVLGLCLLREPMRRAIEVTEGRANVTYPAPDDATFDSAKFLKTGWNYKTIQPADGTSPPFVQLVCNSSCYKPADTHISGRHVSKSNQQVILLIM
jgi:hypothetical protein